MELYHITCKVYPIGRVPTLEGESFYHLSTQIDDRAWINQFLDSQKSSEMPSRKKAFYACDSIMNCKALKSTVAKPHCTPRIYKVRMATPSKSPMALVNHLFQLGQNHTKNVEVANEYWNPTEDWKYYEYLSDEMEVIEQITIENWISGGLIALGEDRELANKLYKL
jgi:hypothetical protein